MNTTETLSSLALNTLGKIHGIAAKVLPDMKYDEAEAYLARLVLLVQTLQSSYPKVFKKTVNVNPVLLTDAELRAERNATAERDATGKQTRRYAELVREINRRNAVAGCEEFIADLDAEAKQQA
jgi:hypothetical protein